MISRRQSLCAVLAAWLLAGSAIVVRAQESETTRTIRTLAFSADGKMLAAGSGGILAFGSPPDPGTLTVWDVASRRVRFSHHDKHGFPSVAFSPDGKLLAAGNFSEFCHLYETDAGKLTAQLGGHGTAARAVAFSADGKTLATGSYDFNVRLWDVATSKLRQTLPGHSQRIFTVAFSADDTLLASASADQTVRLWDVKNGKLLHALSDSQGEVMGVAFVPRPRAPRPKGEMAAGAWLASIGSDNNVRFYDSGTGKPRGQLEGAGNAGLAFTPDGTVLATCDSTRALRLYKLACRDATAAERGQIQELLVRLDDDSYDVREKASKDLLRLGWPAEPLLAAAMNETKSVEVRIRCRRLRQALQSVQPDAVLRDHEHELKCVAISPDGRTLAAAGREGVVYLWDLQTRKQMGTLLLTPPSPMK